MEQREKGRKKERNKERKKERKRKEKRREEKKEEGMAGGLGSARRRRRSEAGNGSGGRLPWATAHAQVNRGAILVKRGGSGVHRS